jgi:hypothetical protein
VQDIRMNDREESLLDRPASLTAPGSVFFLLRAQRSHSSNLINAFGRPRDVASMDWKVRKRASEWQAI